MAHARRRVALVSLVLLVFVILFAAACSREKALQTACEAGDPGACDVLSARYAYGDGLRKDPELAAKLGERARELCAREDAQVSPSCSRIHVIKSVPLTLPRSRADGGRPSGGDVQTVLTVTLLPDGTARIDDREVATDEAILAAATSAREKDPETRAVIKADQTVPHGRVIHVLDLLKQAQIGKIAFGVQPTEPAPR